MMSPKRCLPVGCTDAREIRLRLRLGLPGHTAPPCGGTPRLSSPPRHHPGMLAALSLFIISDSSGCQRLAACRASKYRAGKRLWKGTEEGLRGLGRENAGVRRGGTFCGHGDSPCVACPLRSYSSRHPAQLPGGRLTRLSSPHRCLPTRDPGTRRKACAREKGICEQFSPLPAAGVCRARSHCRDVISRWWMTHRSACLPPGPDCFRSV